MHRSGTSLCSHLLSLLGLDMADIVHTPEGHSIGNAKGHWERWDIVALHDRVLRHFDRDYYDPKHARPLPVGWWADPAVRLIRDEITAWLRGRMGSSRRFGLKDPRTVRLMPMWKEILADLDVQPRFVFCLRHPAPVAKSMAERDKLTVAEGAYRWLVYNTEAVNGLGGAPVHIVPYDRWFTEPLANLAVLTDIVGNVDPADPLVLRMMDTVVDPALRHHQAAPEGSAAGPAGWFHAMLMQCVGTGQFSTESRIAAAAFSGFAGLLTPVQDELDRLSGVAAKLQDTEAERARLAESLQLVRGEFAAMAARHEQAAAAAAQLRAELDDARAKLHGAPLDPPPPPLETDVPAA